MSGFDISQEGYDKPYAKVAEGVWTISEDHFHPAGFSHFPPCNNRGFVYRVKPKSGTKGEHLLLSGIPGKSCIPAVQQLEKETGLNLTLIVGGGDFHHMSIKYWLDAYPNVKILHSDMKFTKTRNGQDILQNPTYRKQLELSSDVNFPQLDEYSDTVRFFGFDRFTSYQDKDYMSKTVDEPVKMGYWKFMTTFPGEQACEPVFLVWHYHVPTKQLIYDHNFLFHFTLKEHKQLPFPLNLLMPVEAFGSAAREQFPHGPATLEDCRAHCEQMARVTALDVRAMYDYHCAPGVQVRTWSSREEFQTDFKDALSITGEDDVTGRKMYQIMKPKDKTMIVAAMTAATFAAGAAFYLKRNT